MLKTKLCGVRLRNPLMLAAGVLGSHASSLNWILKSGAGAVVSKSFSKEPNDGYKNPTTVAVDGGIINAIGLACIIRDKATLNLLVVLIQETN